MFAKPSSSLSTQSLADPVEKALDSFQDSVLSIWEKTAGAAFDKMVWFEDAFATAVAIFSFAAWGKDFSPVPQLVKALIGVDLQDVTDVMMSLGDHIMFLLDLLKGLMNAFASEVFETFVSAAVGSIFPALNFLLSIVSLSLSLSLSFVI